MTGLRKWLLGVIDKARVHLQRARHALQRRLVLRALRRSGFDETSTIYLRALSSIARPSAKNFVSMGFESVSDPALTKRLIGLLGKRFPTASRFFELESQARAGSPGSLADWAGLDDEALSEHLGLRKVLFRRRLEAAVSANDASYGLQLVDESIELKLLLKSYLLKFGYLFQVARRAGKAAEARHSLNRLLAAWSPARGEQLILLNVLYEFACELGEHGAYLESLDIAPEDMPWRGGMALLEQSHSVHHACAQNLERLHRSAAGELFDLRYNRQQQDELHRELLETLAERRPLSMLRIGDGESYGFRQEVDPAVDRADKERRERLWWGRTLEDPNLWERFHQRLMKALTTCDLLGLPTPFRLLRDLAFSEEQLALPFAEQPITLRTWPVLLEQIEELFKTTPGALNGTRLLDARCHHVLFGPQRTRELIAAAEQTVLVNCFPHTHVAAALGAPIDQGLLLPPHQKVLKQLPKHPLTGRCSLELLDDLDEQLEQRCGPGTLVLFAAGIVGKPLIAKARSMGAVALDVGAAVDYWMGLKSRGLTEFADFNRPAGT